MQTSWEMEEKQLDVRFDGRVRAAALKISLDPNSNHSNFSRVILEGFFFLFLPFDPGGLFFGRVFQAVHGRGVHKIAQVGAGSRASSIPERLLLLLLILHLLFLFFSYPFDDSDSVALRDINVDHSSTARHHPVGFHAAAVIPTADHSGHSGSLPRIIIAVSSLVLAGWCSVAMDEKRIDSTPRCSVRHPSLSSQAPPTPSNKKQDNTKKRGGGNAETIGGIYIFFFPLSFPFWMDGWCGRRLFITLRNNSF